MLFNKLTNSFFKVIWGYTRLLPHGSTAVLTLLWQNSWSAIEEMQETNNSYTHLRIDNES